MSPWQMEQSFVEAVTWADLGPDDVHGPVTSMRRTLVDCLRSLPFDEALCIGCTLCIQACPVDCIVGAAKRMHTVIESQCTGCELCVPACPVDCIALLEATPGCSGWRAWSPAQAADSRLRYRAREARRARRRRER